MRQGYKFARLMSKDEGHAYSPAHTPHSHIDVARPLFFFFVTSDIPSRARAHMPIPMLLGRVAPIALVMSCGARIFVPCASKKRK
ncbi:hypothetical protein M422DRAFT_33293 [Sphaerobolus stellatus SS14]|uniref:Unplaced genomic scaffold SPHSTscaffold_85, whole genome shotgun sequence n=1 Tax=Sphaerobolus stellatus (strain SS14) TaxID=990650 RepID=A0A0C9VAE2_SPHS4|nr:hypothetical protein M422DRAFT_33293 [Sphaerobolus stellatus SS14]